MRFVEQFYYQYPRLNVKILARQGYKWLLLCMGMVTLVTGLTIIINQRLYQPETVQPVYSSFITQPIQKIPHSTTTGLVQYKLAQNTALKWADDAELILVTTHWASLNHIIQLSEPTPWSYHFYSSTYNRKLLITVDPNQQVHTIEHVTSSTFPPPPIDIENWLLDSPIALQNWLNLGGESLLKTSNDEVECVIQLRQTKKHPHPIWVVIGLNQSLQATSTTIDSVTGEIVNH